jgi:formamidopyrimidine-DNA glycosylase
MPEAAELETLRTQISPFLPARVLSVSIWGDRTVRAHDPALMQNLVGSSLVSASRLGKWLFLHTDASDPAAALLVVHLRMSGRLTIAEPEMPFEPHTHASFTLLTPLGVRQLRFTDPRTFGEVRLAKSVMDVAPRVPDVSEALTLRDIPRSLTSSRRAIKTVLLEQSLFVQGVGNYLADEVCHEARVSPLKVCQLLTVPEWQRIMQALPVCFERFALLRGVALEDEGWRDLFGVLGDGATGLLVHGRKTCGTCAGPVTRSEVTGRSAYHCPRCQR